MRRVQPQRRKPVAGGDAQLQLHQVQPRDLLGDGVLDLQARIGLDEDKRPIIRSLIDQEFEGAQAAIAQPLGHRQRSLGQRCAQREAQAGAGRDLHQLLVLALQRAFPLAQAHHLLTVADDLDLDVAGA